MFLCKNEYIRRNNITRQFQSILPLLLPILAFVSGLAILLWGAGKLVDGAVSCAFHFGMPRILVGMLIVGFGTSSPEIVVSILASIEGNSGIILGNAYGSNIANIGLILGISALLYPIAVQKNIFRKELPILIGISIIAAVQFLDFNVSFWDAFALLSIFGIITGYSIYGAVRHPEKSDDTGDTKNVLPLKNGIVWLIVGLVLLTASSRILIWGSVEIARILGIGELMIGLTIVAFGTSLPELATSVLAAKKKEHDISMGNVIGSNMFNTLVVVGIAGVIRDIPVDRAFVNRDIVVAGGLTIFLFLFCIGKTKRINRPMGVIFLIAYIAYTVYLVMQIIYV